MCRLAIIRRTGCWDGRTSRTLVTGGRVDAAVSQYAVVTLAVSCAEVAAEVSRTSGQLGPQDVRRK